MRVFDIRREKELLTLSAIAHAISHSEEFNKLFREIRGLVYYEERLDHGRWIKKMKDVFKKLKNIVFKAKAK